MRFGVIVPKMPLSQSTIGVEGSQDDIPPRTACNSSSVTSSLPASLAAVGSALMPSGTHWQPSRISFSQHCSFTTYAEIIVDDCFDV